ncbi:MAG: CvpA family protein [Clostridiales bacterium]|nr:CvpA family protein [Clostridiales bacterium]
MFFDILILVIIVVCAVFGFRNGFLISLSRIGGWIGALVIAFFFREQVSDWLIENTETYTRTQERISNVCQTFVENYVGYGDPSGGAGGFSVTLGRVGDALATAAAEQIMTHLWTVIVFVGIVLGIKLILFVLTLLLSKKFHSGMLGGIDGVAGLLFGLFQAIACILVIFALILPLSYTVSADLHDDIERSMNESIVAKLIYDNNPLLDLIDGFLPTGLTPDKWLDPNNYENVLRSGDGP